MAIHYKYMWRTVNCRMPYMCATPTWYERNKREDSLMQAWRGYVPLLEVTCTAVAYLPDAYLVPGHRHFTGIIQNPRQIKCTYNPICALLPLIMEYFCDIYFRNQSLLCKFATIWLRLHHTDTTIIITIARHWRPVCHMLSETYSLQKQ